MIPVDGESRPATPRSAGSSARRSAAASGRRSVDPVRRRRGGDAGEPAALVVAGRHDDLAEARVRHPAVGAEGVEPLAAPHAEPRLGRALRVVDAGVDHLGIARAGLAADETLGLEHQHLVPGLRQRPRRRQPDDARPDHDAPDLVHLRSGDPANPRLKPMCCDLTKRPRHVARLSSFCARGRRHSFGGACAIFFSMRACTRPAPPTCSTWCWPTACRSGGGADACAVPARGRGQPLSADPDAARRRLRPAAPSRRRSRRSPPPRRPAAHALPRSSCNTVLQHPDRSEALRDAALARGLRPRILTLPAAPGLPAGKHLRPGHPLLVPRRYPRLLLLPARPRRPAPGDRGDLRAGERPVMLYQDEGPNDLLAFFLTALGISLDRAALAPVSPRNQTAHRAAGAVHVRSCRRAVRARIDRAHMAFTHAASPRDPARAPAPSPTTAAPLPALAARAPRPGRASSGGQPGAGGALRHRRRRELPRAAGSGRALDAAGADHRRRAAGGVPRVLRGFWGGATGRRRSPTAPAPGWSSPGCRARDSGPGCAFTGRALSRRVVRRSRRCVNPV